MTARVLLIDNYDSFTYNLAHGLAEAGAEVVVHRHDAIDVAGAIALAPTHLVISPGPGSPHDPAYFGVCREVILELGKTTPLLGVCLGHQGIGAMFGGKVVRAPVVMHGKTSPTVHDGTGVFAGIASPAIVMRYHSLIVERETLPSCLRVNATTEDGLIMGLVHREHPIHGVQFHPESIGSGAGTRMLKNFLEL